MLMASPNKEDRHPGKGEALVRGPFPRLRGRGPCCSADGPRTAAARLPGRRAREMATASPSKEDRHPGKGEALVRGPFLRLRGRGPRCSADGPRTAATRLPG